MPKVEAVSLHVESWTDAVRLFTADADGETISEIALLPEGAIQIAADLTSAAHDVIAKRQGPVS